MVKPTVLLARLLELFAVAQSITPDEIKNLKVHSSHIYGLQTVYSFDYDTKHYYVTDDYSLMDNEQYIRHVLEEFTPTLTGKLRKNPTKQSDGALFACGLDDKEYYLWECM
jgi:hypothetical protein